MTRNDLRTLTGRRRVLFTMLTTLGDAPIARAERDLWGEELDHEGEWHPSYDEKAEEAKGVLTELFAQQPPRVYYTRQLAILLEKPFYHWITKRALRDLVSAQVIGTDLLPLTETTTIRFFWPRRLRYWRRQAAEIRDLILEYSRTDFGHALALHGETLFDAALPRMGGVLLPHPKHGTSGATPERRGRRQTTI